MFSLWLAPLLVVAQQSQLPSHLTEGVGLLQQQDVKGAIAALEAIVSEDPEDGQAWYFLGLARHTAGELVEAQRGHLLASLLVKPGHPFHTNAAYNMACAFALQGKTERSLRWLHRARNAGFANSALLGSDTDLDSLREDERFMGFVSHSAIGDVADVEVSSVTAKMPGNTGGVEVGPDGALYVADFGSKVYRVQSDGSWELFADGFQTTADCTFDSEGHLLQVDHKTSRVTRIAPDGTQVDAGIEGLSYPVGIDVAGDRSIWLTNYRTNAITCVDPDGAERTVATGGLLNGPNGVAVVDGVGVFIVNFNDGCVLRLDPDEGTQHFVAELPGGGNGHIVWSGEAFYVTGRRDHRIYRVTTGGRVDRVAGNGTQGTLDGAGAASQLSLPNGIAISGDGGALFVNDNLGPVSVVRKVALGTAVTASEAATAD